MSQNIFNLIFMCELNSIVNELYFKSWGILLEKWHYLSLQIKENWVLGPPLRSKLLLTIIYLERILCNGSFFNSNANKLFKYTSNDSEVNLFNAMESYWALWAIIERRYLVLDEIFLLQCPRIFHSMWCKRAKKIQPWGHYAPQSRKLVTS